MHYAFKNSGVCSSKVEFDVEENRVRNIAYTNGCNGNLKALASLAEGMTVDEVIEKLGGITCGSNGTSCGDQLARHLRGLKTKSL
jgi:uncharacterized protein (TIGR03905 family)